jgi:putative oxidoreductase
MMDATTGRGRTARNAASWVLSVLLALVFLTTGVEKLVGGETPWIPAAAMQTYPSWFRIVVGVLEVAGAVALLIPAYANLAGVALAIAMAAAVYTHLVQGQPGALIPFSLLIALLLVLWLRNPGWIRRSARPAH